MCLFKNIPQNPLERKAFWGDGGEGYTGDGGIIYRGDYTRLNVWCARGVVTIHQILQYRKNNMCFHNLLFSSVLFLYTMQWNTFACSWCVTSMSCYLKMKYIQLFCPKEELPPSYTADCITYWLTCMFLFRSDVLLGTSGRLCQILLMCLCCCCWVLDFSHY